MRRDRPAAEIARSVLLAAVLALGVTAATLGKAVSASAAMRQPKVKMALPRSIPPHPALFGGACGYSGPDDSATCNAAVIKAINYARKFEPLRAMPKSFKLAAFDKLSRVEQIFATADIERTARGLPAIAGITAQLDAIAASGAAHESDPSADLPLHLSTGGMATTYGSNWAGGIADPMAADYFWMYDDGPGSPNAACTTSSASSCWGHRKNVLGDWSDPAYCPAGSKVNAVMGVAEVTSKVAFSPSITEIFMNDCGPLPKNLVFTWPQVEKLVFGQ